MDYVLLLMIQQQHYCEDYVLILTLHSDTDVAYFLKIYFKMCEVWPASSVPWVSSGYLCVKIQCRCVKCGTFVPSDLI